MRTITKLKILETLKEYHEYLVNFIPEHLQTQFKQESYIAGGSIYSIVNNREIKDVDFFVETLDLKMNISTFFKNLNGVRVKQSNGVMIYMGNYNGKSYVITNNALTVGKCQIIFKDYGKPEDVVGRFDFEHNMHYVKNNELYNLKKWTTLYSDRLIYNKERARDIVGTIMRLPKFLERGFEISNQEMATMLLKLHEVGFNDEELLMLRGKLGSISFGSGE